MNLKTPSFKRFWSNQEIQKGCEVKIYLGHKTHPFHPLFINVVDYMTNESGLFRYKLYRPKKTDVNVSPSGRNCLNFGLLGSHGFSETQYKTNNAQCSQYSGK